MKPTAESLIEKFRQSSSLFISKFESIDEQMLNWKPSAESWSIAQVMEHIIIANESYYPVFENLKAGKNKVPAIASISFIPKLLGDVILKGTQPDAKRKVKTFPIWQPKESSVSGIIERFKQHHEILFEKVRSIEEFLNRGVIISSPASKYVVYSLDKAFEIMLVHELRHFLQASNVFESHQSKTRTN